MFVWEQVYLSLSRLDHLQKHIDLVTPLSSFRRHSMQDSTTLAQLRSHLHPLADQKAAMRPPSRSPYRWYLTRARQAIML